MPENDRSTRSSSMLGWLVLTLAGLTGYVIWQIAPLTARLDALERDRLAAKDEILGELDRLATRIAAEKRPSQAPRPAAEAQAAAPGPAAAGTSPSPAPGPRAAVAISSEALQFLDRHLFPADAVIARLIVGNAPPENIARLTNHSRAYVIARGVQIEKLVSGAPGAPPEIARALRQWTRDNARR